MFHNERIGRGICLIVVGYRLVLTNDVATKTLS